MMPSRYTAEEMERSAREAFLQEVNTEGGKGVKSIKLSRAVSGKSGTLSGFRSVLGPPLPKLRARIEPGLSPR